MSDGRVADREPDKGHLGAPGRVWPAFLTGTLLHFLARAAISAIRSGPVLVADEIGNLGNARASGWTSPQSATEAAGGGPIAYDLDHYETTGFHTVQWCLPDSRIVLFHGDTEAAPAPLVFSDEASDSEHPGSGAVEILPNAGRDESLWRLRSRQSP